MTICVSNTWCRRANKNVLWQPWPEKDTCTMTVAAVYHATIEMALWADQESASSLPVRGSHQEKMKAPRQEASSHYRLSVNSAQTSFGKMRVESGRRAFLKRDDWRWNWKKSLWAWEVLIRKKRWPADPLHDWRRLSVISVCIHTWLHK